MKVTEVCPKLLLLCEPTSLHPSASAQEGRGSELLPHHRDRICGSRYRSDSLGESEILDLTAAACSPKPAFETSSSHSSCSCGVRWRTE
jgi:hypothetical protein